MPWFYYTDGVGDFGAVRIDDPATVSQARDLIEQGDVLGNNIAGNIVIGASQYNFSWSFYLDPDSIFFFEFVTEVGDSTFRLIEEDLESVGQDFLPGNTWTPWTSQILHELNDLRGDTGDNVINGGVSHDIVFGRAGNDLLRGLDGDDLLSGGNGDDTLIGGNGNDVLDGNNGNNRMRGQDGDDQLVASAGNNAMLGGAGADEFIFKAPEALRQGVVGDFNVDDGDLLRIDPGWLGLAAAPDLFDTTAAQDFIDSLVVSRNDLVFNFDADTRIILRDMASVTLTVDDVVIL